jgi:hypothetical protein
MELLRHNARTEELMAIDLFHNVHKGIRHALFDAAFALGRGDDDARERLRNALHFTAHHGQNEDVLLVPLLVARLPSIAIRMRIGHEEIGDMLHRLRRDLEGDTSLAALYARTCAFTSRYLEHIAEEEELIDPAIRSAYRDEELTFIGRESMARTSPDDARMMLKLMLPSLTKEDARGYFAKLPPTLATELRGYSRCG